MLIEFGSIEDADFAVVTTQPTAFPHALVVSLFGRGASLRLRNVDRVITPYHTDDIYPGRRMFQIVPVGEGEVVLDDENQEIDRSWTYDVTWQRFDGEEMCAARVILIRAWDEPFDWDVVVERNGVRVDISLPLYCETPVAFEKLAPPAFPRTPLRLI